MAGLVLLYGMIGCMVTGYVLVVVAFPVAAAHFYPGNPDGVALVRALHPWVAGVTLFVGSVLTALMTLRIGRHVDPALGEHKFLFIPYQAWSVIYAGIGVAVLVCSLIPGVGLIGMGVGAAKDKFVGTCERYDRAATPEGCECMAIMLVQRTPPEMFIPFFENAEDLLRYGYGRPMIDWLNANATRVSEVEDRMFARGLTDALTCLADASKAREGGAAAPAPVKPQ